MRGMGGASHVYYAEIILFIGHETTRLNLVAYNFKQDDTLQQKVFGV